MRIRYILLLIILLAAMARPVLSADNCNKCLPLISGNLWWLDADMFDGGMSKWRDELDNQQKIGFDILWLINTDSVIDLPGDPLKQLLDLCAKRHIKVIIDAGTSGAWYHPFDLDKETDACKKHIQKIGERYAGHPAFYAWYIYQEIYMCWPGNSDYDYIFKLYPSLVKMCKRSANLPVIVSPFFILDRDKIYGNFRYNEPGEYRDFWAKLLKKSGIDIVMLQDSGEHFSYVTMDQRRPFFQAMFDACKESGAKLWGNVEVAEMVCDSPESFVQKYGRVHHSMVSIPWRPVPIDRLKQKLELASEYSERIVSWGYKEYCRPDIGVEAAKWYEDYKAYYREHRKP